MTDFAKNSRIALGADHAGFQLKAALLRHLESAGYVVDDVGTWTDASVDYPDYAAAVAERVAGHLVCNHGAALGILVCGTGIGMSIAANKVAGIRAAVVRDAATARLAREHNDANVLTLGSRLLTEAEAVLIVNEFLAASFAGGRHERRIQKIAELDQAREQKA
jgi:ribose 5-phosphate isomerase B